MATTVEDTGVCTADGLVVLGYLRHVKIGSNLDLGSGVVCGMVGGVDQLFGSVNDQIAVLVLLNEAGLCLTAIVASSEFIPYMVGNVYGSFVAVRSAFADECSVTVVFTVRVNLFVGVVQNGNHILAKVLVERDVALVAIQTIANLTACQLLGSSDNHATGSLVESRASIYVLDNGIALVTGNGVTVGLVYLDVANHQHAFVKAASATPTGNTTARSSGGTRNGSGKHNIAEGCTTLVTSVDTSVGTVAADFRNQVNVAGYVLDNRTGVAVLGNRCQVFGVRGVGSVNNQVLYSTVKQTDGGTTYFNANTCFDMCNVKGHLVSLAVEYRVNLRNGSTLGRCKGHIGVQGYVSVNDDGLGHESVETSHPLVKVFLRVDLDDSVLHGVLSQWIVGSVSTNAEVADAEGQTFCCTCVYAHCVTNGSPTPFLACLGDVQVHTLPFVGGRSVTQIVGVTAFVGVTGLSGEEKLELGFLRCLILESKSGLGLGEVAIQTSGCHIGVSAYGGNHPRTIFHLFDGSVVSVTVIQTENVSIFLCQRCAGEQECEHHRDGSKQREEVFLPHSNDF